MLRNTLTFRLVLISTAWVAGSLLVAGLLLVWLFRGHIERRFEAELVEHLDELLAASEISPQSGLQLSWTPSEPSFNRPYSGWYWQIAHGNAIVARSDSLWRNRLRNISPGQGGGMQHFAGPSEEPLRGLVQNISLPGANDRFTYVVAGPMSDIERNVDQFVTELTVTLCVLGFGLVAAVLAQVYFGLRPLRKLQHALVAVRSGRLRRLPDSFPEELKPLVLELNALLDHTNALLERTRTQAGNLAHALKNPLTVIRNELRDAGDERGRLLQDQMQRVMDFVERYLARARAAGAADIIGARAPLRETIEELQFSMEVLYKDCNLSFQVCGVRGLFFRGDRRDLEEMLGNLMDNACKWARSQVVVRAKKSDGHVLLTVEDDGPGIPKTCQAEVFSRGRRLDEAMPGSGLGLDIVRDTAELYRGALNIGTSSLGGICASLELPAAE
jgi:signal transduction histidine kinase